jgi:hypothetical protein
VFSVLETTALIYACHAGDAGANPVALTIFSNRFDFITACSLRVEHKAFPVLETTAPLQFVSITKGMGASPIALAHFLNLWERSSISRVAESQAFSVLKTTALLKLSRLQVAGAIPAVPANFFASCLKTKNALICLDKRVFILH